MGSYYDNGHIAICSWQIVATSIQYLQKMLRRYYLHMSDVCNAVSSSTTLYCVNRRDRINR